MNISDDHGIRIATLSVEEALRQSEDDRPDVDLLRVDDPAPEHWPALEDAGFILKPQWITWVARAEQDEDTYVERLSGRERKAIRKARRATEADRVQIGVHEPPTEEAVDGFLHLYRRQIAAMRHGVDYARAERDAFLDPANGYVVVTGHVDGDLVGAVVCRADRADDAMLVRFTATTPEARRRRLNRVLYLRAFSIARTKQLSFISLGSDPALYGALTEPGLHSFKTGMGFSPVPEHHIAEDDDKDEAILILRASALTDPALIVAYDTTRDRPTSAPPRRAIAAALDDPVPLRLVVVTAAGEDDAQPLAPLILR
ncbi:GNAT family N-acetyltransferase [Actinacidiphila bryophytorum]|uniref:GNAT family N-acetyltransferase n=1 Tax=Actinacidiphila bryophytorum TaxID=1436133 RepID=UPI002176A603|nr:GNAT family N-acetyltransferase [Actinacidiphila bryophytorum]UWE10247.1 GNAT family N-acetyltransferase [Actinacidiphila bryophytorum]